MKGGMFILSRKEICVTRNFEYLNRVRGILTENNIEYTVKTNTITNPGRMYGVPFIDSNSAYEYRVYVRKADCDMARRFIETVK